MRSPATTPTPRPFEVAVRALVSRIPRGRVATYGQIAALAGFPRHARHVGRVLSALPAGSRLPWHRVLNAQGRVSIRAGAQGPDARQARLLTREGVDIAGGRVNLARHLWRPEEGAGWFAGQPLHTTHDLDPAPRR